MLSPDGSADSASPRGNNHYPSRDDDRFRAAEPSHDKARFSADEPSGDNVFSRPDSSWPDFPDQPGQLSTSDEVAFPAGGRHSDGRGSPPGLRMAPPKHLRDDLPAPLPPPPDARRAAERADSTVPMPAVRIGRRRLNPKVWLSAAGVVLVMVATTLLLTNRPLTSPEPDTWAGPGPIATPSPSDEAAIIPASSPVTTPTAPPTTTRPGGLPSPRPRGTLNTGGAIIVPVAPGTTEAQPPPAPPPPPPPPNSSPSPTPPTPLPVVSRTGRLVVASVGTCLDNKAASAKSSNPIQLYPCNATVAQVFTHNASDNGTIRVQGLCIKPSGSGAGSLIQLRACDSSPAGQWYFRSDKVIVNRQYSMCLTRSNRLVDGQAQATMEVCTAAANQQWSFG